jgi:hypothetical protein
MKQFETPEKDVALALALAVGASTTAAAEQAGISRVTAWRKLADPAFRQLVANLRAELMAEAVGKLANTMNRAADALATTLDSADERVRLRGARAVLTLGHRLHESIDLDERIREIEERLDPGQGGES